MGQNLKLELNSRRGEVRRTAVAAPGPGANRPELGRWIQANLSGFTPEIKSRAFEEWLASRGYKPNTIKFQRYLVNGLGRWLSASGRNVGDLSPAVVAEFVCHYNAHYVRVISPAALAAFGDFVRAIGIEPAPTGPPLGGVDLILEGYRNYLLSERGLAPSTVRASTWILRPFLEGRVHDGRLELASITPAELVDTIVGHYKTHSPKSTKSQVSALRSFLDYLYMQGILSRRLSQAVPQAAHHSLAGLPPLVGRDEVRRLLESCDRSSASGRRSFAVITLLARLGLRAGEVAALMLEDIDWRSGEIRVRGKGGHVEAMPLPADAGEALAEYLSSARPETALVRNVLVRIHAPHLGMSGRAVSWVVADAARRAGLGVMHAHRLRHFAATETLAKGAGLAEVGELLRHRSLISTAIYAKVNREALRVIARPWPGAAR